MRKTEYSPEKLEDKWLTASCHIGTMETTQTRTHAAIKNKLGRGIVPYCTAVIVTKHMTTFTYLCSSAYSIHFILTHTYKQSYPYNRP
jgi:hypothetical protein